MECLSRKGSDYSGSNVRTFKLMGWLQYLLCHHDIDLFVQPFSHDMAFQRMDIIILTVAHSFGTLYQKQPTHAIIFHGKYLLNGWIETQLVICGDHFDKIIFHAQNPDRNFKSQYWNTFFAYNNTFFHCII